MTVYEPARGGPRTTTARGSRQGKTLSTIRRASPTSILVSVSPPSCGRTSPEPRMGI